MIFQKEKDNYTLYGALFGICFPIGAITLEIILRELDFSLASIIYLHTEVLLLWMIDSAPFVLGIFARFAGTKQDNLAETLEGMQKVIDERTRHLEASMAQTEKTGLEKEQLSELSQITTRENSSKGLAQAGISFIAQISDSNVGVLYLAEDQKLRFLASYAFNENEEHQLEMEFGESLLGQCALEQKVMVINELKRDYLKIQSSMGEADANFIIILPVLFEGNLLGVLELGSFQPYTEEGVEFLKKATDIIAVSLNAALNQEKLSELVAQLKAG